ncbi:MAG: CYTH domain-containing protein [Hyphomicrobiaceae bacterium]
MSFEIERKFLLASDAWRALATDRIPIRQAYLSGDGKASIRVRIKDKGGATLTVKSRGAERRRLELEYPIPVLEAEAMIALRRGSLIEKVRHAVPYGGCIWEVDVFEGENAGLVIAEVELLEEHQRIDVPAWVGPEVTGQPQYYNGALALRPFRTWPEVPSVAMGATPVSGQ